MPEIITTNTGRDDAYLIHTATTTTTMDTSTTDDYIKHNPKKKKTSSSSRSSRSAQSLLLHVQVAAKKIGLRRNTGKTSSTGYIKTGGDGDDDDDGSNSNTTIDMVDGGRGDDSDDSGDAAVVTPDSSSNGRRRKGWKKIEQASRSIQMRKWFNLDRTTQNSIDRVGGDDSKQNQMIMVTSVQSILSNTVLPFCDTVLGGGINGKRRFGNSRHHHMKHKTLKKKNTSKGGTTIRTKLLQRKTKKSNEKRKEDGDTKFSQPSTEKPSTITHAAAPSVFTTTADSNNKVGVPKPACTSTNTIRSISSYFRDKDAAILRREKIKRMVIKYRKKKGNKLLPHGDNILRNSTSQQTQHQQQQQEEQQKRPNIHLFGSGRQFQSQLSYVIEEEDEETEEESSDCEDDK